MQGRADGLRGELRRVEQELAALPGPEAARGGGAAASVRDLARRAARLQEQVRERVRPIVVPCRRRHASWLEGRDRVCPGARWQVKAAEQAVGQGEALEAEWGRLQAALVVAERRVEAACGALGAAEARAQAVHDAVGSDGDNDDDDSGDPEAVGGGAEAAGRQGASECHEPHALLHTLPCASLTTRSGRSLLAGLSALADACQARVDELDGEVGALEAEREQRRRDLAALQQRVARLEQQQQHAQQRLSACQQAAGRADGAQHEERHRELVHAARSLQEQIAAARLRIRVLAGLLHAPHADATAPPMPGSSGALPGRLHALFTFKRPAAYADGERWRKALSVAAGGALTSVVVVGSSADAKDPQRLQRACPEPFSGPAAPSGPSQQHPQQRQDGGALRVWPLDRITCADLSAKQRQAQQELGAGARTNRTVASKPLQRA